MSQNKRLEELTAAEVAAWILTLSNIPAKSKAAEIVKQEEINGKALYNATNPTALTEVDIPEMTSKPLFEAIKSRKASESVKKIEQPNYDRYVIKVSRNSSKIIELTDCFKGMKIVDLKSRLRSEHSINNITVYAARKAVSDETKTLEFYGIFPPHARVTIAAKTNGGASSEPIRHRQLNTKDPRITLTKKKDCISFEDGEEFPNAEMVCGHAIGCYSMFEYLKATLEKNCYDYEIRCPVSECGKVWDFNIVAVVADLSEEEYEHYSQIMEERFGENLLKECPLCQIMCSRDQSLNGFRTRCLGCNGGDFCWTCGKLWKGSGPQLCGNEGCPIMQINDILEKCKPKKAANDVEIPMLRACPNCLTLIEHEERCKHMTCMGCGKKFCFSCLRSPDANNNWPCGSSGYQCEKAPRQILK